VPLGSTVSLATLVRSSTLDISASPSSRSSRPGPLGRPIMRSTDGRATSASTSRTVWSSSVAMLIARLIELKVLPSPASALVTMMRLACTPALWVVTLRSSGRLMTRYWSAVRVRGASGVMKPAAASASRSRSTWRDTGTGGATAAGAVAAADAAAASCGAGEGAAGVSKACACGRTAPD
jgi:hypothetical protein